MSKPTTNDWYLDFFDDLAIDLWQRAVPDEQTLAEATFLIEALEIAPGDNLIDVRCGFGRHAVELAARGLRVTGIDVSPCAIERARSLAEQRNVSVDWRLAEMRQLPCEVPFDAAICLGNSFGYLDEEGTGTFLHNLGRVLRPGARFVLNSGMIAESMLPELAPKLEFTAGDIHRAIVHDYRPEASCIETTYTFTRAGEAKARRAWYFVLTLAQVHRMLASAGFMVLDCYCSAAREPYKLGSPVLYLVAERRASP